MTHRMILATADLNKVYKMVVAKRKAPLAQREEPWIRKPQTAVRGCDGAPELEENHE